MRDYDQAAVVFAALTDALERHPALLDDLRTMQSQWERGKLAAREIAGFVRGLRSAGVISAQVGAAASVDLLFILDADEGCESGSRRRNSSDTDPNAEAHHHFQSFMADLSRSENIRTRTQARFSASGVVLALKATKSINEATFSSMLQQIEQSDDAAKARELDTNHLMVAWREIYDTIENALDADTARTNCAMACGYSKALCAAGHIDRSQWRQLDDTAHGALASQSPK